MGQIYRDPLPDAVNPGIFSKGNTESFDPQSQNVEGARNEVFFKHFQENTRLGHPTILNAIVLSSGLSYEKEDGTKDRGDPDEGSTPKVLIHFRIPGMEAVPAPCAIPVGANVWTAADMEAEAGKSTDENIGSATPIPDANAIANHRQAVSRDLVVCAQPLPLPGSTIQINISTLGEGLQPSADYIGPILNMNVPFPEMLDPPPNPGDCMEEGINPFADPPEPPPPCINIPRVAPPTGKVGTPRPPGPPVVESQVWGGYGSDSGIVVGSDVHANPKTGTVAFQAKRNKKAGGSTKDAALKAARRDNNRFARFTGDVGNTFLQYVAVGGSGKSDPTNKPLGGTMSFKRVRELVSLPTVNAFSQQSGFNALEKYLICLMAAAEDQSDRPYEFTRTGYAPPASGFHCAAYVNNVRHIAYALFHAEGKNLDITNITLETYAGFKTIRSSLIFDRENFPAGPHYTNIVARNATSLQDKNERKRLKVVKGRPEAYQYGVHDGSLIGSFIWKSEGKATPWTGQAPIMPGDMIHPRAAFQIQALLIGASAFEVKPGQQLCVPSDKCPKGILPHWAKRPSMIGHITLTFCGPNGVLMNGESGGAFNGSGAMPLADYIIRNTKAKSRGKYFPSEFLILEPPEMTKIWAAMPGGRPTTNWTPDLFKELCPNLVQLPEIAQHIS